MYIQKITKQFQIKWNSTFISPKITIQSQPGPLTLLSHTRTRPTCVCKRRVINLRLPILGGLADPSNTHLIPIIHHHHYSHTPTINFNFPFSIRLHLHLFPISILIKYNFLQFAIKSHTSQKFAALTWNSDCCDGELPGGGGGGGGDPAPRR